MSYRKKYEGNLDEEIKRTGGLEEKDANTFTKEAALAVLTLLFSGLSWLLIHIVLVEKIFSFNFEDTVDVDTRLLTYAGISLLLMILHIVFLSFTVKVDRSSISFVTVLLTGLIPLIVFFFLNPAYALLGSAVYILGLFVWFSIAKKADRLEGDYSLIYMLRPGLSFLLLLTIVLISFFRFADYIENERDTDAFQKATIGYTLLGVNEVFERLLSDYTKDISVDAFILLLSGQEGGEKGAIQEQERLIDKLFGHLPIDININIELVEEQQAIVRERFFENLKLSDQGFTGNTPITTVWEAFLVNRSSRYTTNLDKFVPALAAIGLFFTLYVFKLVYKLLVYVLGWIFLHLFLFTKFLSWNKKEVIIKELRL